MLELVKNSFNAWLTDSDGEGKSDPVRILVCSDEQRVAIRVSDRSGGIPFDVGDQVWSYLYGAAARTQGKDAPPPTAFAGYGVGLPLSRLHARYLGGKLNLATYPGF